MVDRSGAGALNAAIRKVMERDSRVLTFGLGVTDPGRVFGTTEGLLEKFGSSRVFETPTSELAMTGVGVGLALAGHRVIHSHQRMDFTLLAMDQIVNSAAKWRFMFGDKFHVPYLARMIVGRGWGQGPTHSQNFESWLAHTPGIRVVVPATPQDFVDAIFSLEVTSDPIVLIEHRWLHGVRGQASLSSEPKPYLNPIIHRVANDPLVTIVTWGLATYDALAAQKRLIERGISSLVIQLRELNLIDVNTVADAVRANGNLVVATNSWEPASFGDSIVAETARLSRNDFDFRVVTVAQPHTPEPTSLNLLKGFHVSDWRIGNAVLQILGETQRFEPREPIDQPVGFDFGPF